MSDIGKRIAELRQVANNGQKISQAKFAESLGMGQTAVAAYEVGRSDPSDRTIKDICRIYNVNEDWLRSGVGDMFAPRDREDEIAAFMADIITEDSFRRRVVSAMAKMTVDEWEVLEKILDKLIEEHKKESSDK